MEMIIEKKVCLTFPKEQLNQPLIYKLIRNFDLQTNILEAHISEESGWLVVLVQGDAARVQKGLDWIVEQSVQVEVLSERMVEE
jgi:ABC-type methionine transport system ATPase subunit